MHVIDAAQDYANDASIRRGFAEVMAATGGTLDALYNNGAYALLGATEDIPTDALREIFERAGRGGARLAVSASFLEIYNESLTDLLLPQHQHAFKLEIKEDHSTGDIFVRGLTEVPVHSADGAQPAQYRASQAA